MKTIGLFEAKTKLSEICERVAVGGEAVVITRRGKPLVKIEPMKGRMKSVWDLRAEHERAHGAWTERLELPRRARANFKNPLSF
jgi:prevent-host-death family protein